MADQTRIVPIRNATPMTPTIADVTAMKVKPNSPQVTGKKTNAALARSTAVIAVSAVRNRGSFRIYPAAESA